MADPIAAIEIGTTRTVLAVGEVQQDGRVKVLGITEQASTGVRKSLISDIGQAASAVEATLAKMEKSYDFGVATVSLAVSGPQVSTVKNSGTWPLNSRAVTEDDMTEAKEKARDEADAWLDGRKSEMLQCFDQGYTVGTQPGIDNPLGMNGQSLTHHLLTVFASKDHVADANTALMKANVEVEELVFAGYAAAIAAITPAEMKEGVLAIDLGGGSTSFTVFRGGRLVYAEVIGVGGDHVTNDIAIAFNLTNAQAEGLKCRYGSATLGTAADSRIEIPSPMPGGDVRSISRRALETVVNARMEEIMHIILESMNANGLLHHLNSGAVLTGGGASMKNLVRLAAETLGMRVRVPSALNVDGLEDAANPAAYATVAGMLIHSAKNEVRPEGLLTRLIRKFRK